MTVVALHLLLLAQIALVWDLLTRAGAGPGRWLAVRHAGPADRWAVRWLFGLTVFGSALLGLAMAGLCARPLVVAALPLLAIAAGGLRSPSSPLLAAARSLRGIPLPAAAGVALAGLPVALGLFSPHLDHDSLIYHLGFPMQCLVTRRTPLDHVSLLFHFPLLADLTHALPVALGDDRLAKATSLGALLAGTAVAARRHPGAGWLFLLVALSPRSLVLMAAIAKNDLVAAGLLVAGAVLWRQGARPAAAVLFGASVAAKPIGLPVIMIWTLCFNRMAVGRPMASLIRLPMLFFLPLLPWLLKSWIATGDPAYPHLWKIFAGPFWSAANQASLDAQNIWIADAGRFATLPGAWLRWMWLEFPLQLLALPLLAATGRARPAIAAGLGAMAALHAGRISRYMVPGAWLISIEVAAAAVAWTTVRGLRARALLAVAALALIAGWPETRRVPWAPVLTPTAVTRHEGLSGWADVCAEVAGLAPRRVLAVGTDRIYPLPVRAVYNGFLGETPVVWTLARTARDPGRLRVKFRQLGAPVLIHNFVSIEWMAMFHRPFPWDDRMLRTYHAFARGRITPLAAPRRADREAGGYWVMAVDTAPGARAPAPVYFLPGSESALLAARRFRDLRDHLGAEREIRRVLAVTPGVAYAAGQLGHTLIDQARWQEAYRTFAPLTAAGFLDGTSLWGHGTAAIYAGRYDEAERVLMKAIEIYDTKHANRTNLAWCHQARADALIRRGRPADAEPWLAKSEATLAVVPDTPGAYWAVPRRQIAALVLGSRADLHRLAGRPADARAGYAEAAALAPDLPDAARWKNLIR